jgi:threonine/homoserine/homoserine lactone efflux protein
MPRMELAAVFFSSFLVGLSGALMPGPILTVTIAHAVRRGHLAGPLVSLGHAIVEGALVVGLALGLSQVLQLPMVSGTIGVLGGLCLLYMGAGMIRQPAPTELVSTGAGGHTGMGPVAAGALLSISNPYWVLWWATVGAAYLLLALRYGPLGIAVFFAGHIMADLGWLSAVGSAITAGRNLFTPRIYKGILVVCGAFLLCLGVYFLVSGVNSFQQL